MSDLKPCPFCGGNAAAFTHLPNRFRLPVSHHVECESCGNGTHHHETMNEAITAWNTRTPMSEWQSIETAPRDGTWVLTWAWEAEWTPGVSMAKYNTYLAQLGEGPWDNATHWMPLPDAPSAKDTGDE